MSALSVALRSNAHVPFNYRERVAEIKTKLRDFEHRISLASSTNVKFDGLKVAYANPYKKTIALPSWFVFKYEDIPPYFLVDHIDDPRLKDDHFLNQFAEWMNDKLRDSGLVCICRPVDHGKLQSILLLLRDRQLYEKGKDFMLAHELSHLAYHKESFLVCMGIISLFLALTITPFVPFTVAVGSIGIAIVVIGRGVLYQFPFLSVIEQEKKADLDAVTLLRDAEGGIYNFESQLMFNLVIRSGGGSQGANFDEKGNYLRDTVHPPLADRVTYLRQWQREQQPQLQVLCTGQNL